MVELSAALTPMGVGRNGDGVDDDEGGPAVLLTALVTGGSARDSLSGLRPGDRVRVTILPTE